VFGCLAAAAVTFPRARSWLLRPLRYLGEISYGIYLWHLPVLLTMVAVPWFKQERLLWLMLAGTLAIAAFSWHFFEKPFIRRSHRG
jgi:peptidoglycan/LPS O-acetylase OafA/YrhL